MKKFILYFLCIILFFCFISQAYGAAKYVIFEWDFHTEDIAGYRLYQSDKSMDYYVINEDPNNFEIYWDADKMVGEIIHDPTDIETSTRFTIYSLPMGTYFWVLSAFTEDGRESGPSNEVTTTIDPSSPGNLRIRVYYR